MSTDSVVSITDATITNVTVTGARLPLNGARLMAAFPLTGFGNGIVEWVVVAERPEPDVHDRYVCAYVRNLGDSSWNHDSYRHTFGEALADALDRGGWGQTRIVLPAERA